MVSSGILFLLMSVTIHAIAQFRQETQLGLVIQSLLVADLPQQQLQHQRQAQHLQQLLLVLVPAVIARLTIVR
jgi:hypothetical protein